MLLIHMQWENKTNQMIAWREGFDVPVLSMGSCPVVPALTAVYQLGQDLQGWGVLANS